MKNANLAAPRTLKMKLKSRIERLEGREGFNPTGPIPISVFDRIMNETISDEEWARWQPCFERQDKFIEKFGS
jgi:hypothetical protein